MTELLEGTDVIMGQALGLELEAIEEVTAAQVTVADSIFQKVVDDDQDGMSYRDQSAFLAPASRRAPV